MTTTELILNEILKMDDRSRRFIAAIATAVLHTQQAAAPASDALPVTVTGSGATQDDPELDNQRG